MQAFNSFNIEIPPKVKWKRVSKKSRSSFNLLINLYSFINKTINFRDYNLVTCEYKIFGCFLKFGLPVIRCYQMINIWIYVYTYRWDDIATDSRGGSN